ncbi:hypothetical protein MMC07_002692 [Pseudocyphellaria aurata]|nr:hypothetical protein [Pseudocyphellaria aurata]
MSAINHSTVVKNTGKATRTSQKPGTDTSLLTPNENGVNTDARRGEAASTIASRADSPRNRRIPEQALVEDSMNAGPVPESMTKEQVIAKLREQIAERNTMKEELASLEQEHRRLEAMKAANLRLLDTFLEQSVAVLDFMENELASDLPSRSVSALFESVEMLIQETVRGLDGGHRLKV